MGVDIKCYRKVSKLDCVFDSDGNPIDQTIKNYVRTYVNPDFPGRADDIEHKAMYTFEESDCPVSVNYLGYIKLRNELAKLAGYPLGQLTFDNYCAACWDGKTGPFSELIDFSDCEGVIGTAVSAKLAKDFAKFQVRANKHKSQHFKSFYNGMWTAFEMAADGGFVQFH